MLFRQSFIMYNILIVIFLDMSIIILPIECFMYLCRKNCKIIILGFFGKISINLYQLSPHHLSCYEIQSGELWPNIWRIVCVGLGCIRLNKLAYTVHHPCSIFYVTYMFELIMSAYFQQASACWTLVTAGHKYLFIYTEHFLYDLVM